MLVSHNLSQKLIGSVLFVVGLIFVASCDPPETPSNVAVANQKTLSPTATATASPTAAANATPVVKENAQNLISPTSSSPQANSATNAVDQNNLNVVTAGKLVIPVIGVRREDLRDTFGDARSEGRTHEALDIMAPRGAVVVAASDGEVQFFDSEKGGITIYQINREDKLVYYYAHLERRADNLKEGDLVKKGTVIGYVGDTGNSGVGNYHLHFAVWTLDDPKRYWEGTNVNPYLLLR